MFKADQCAKAGCEYLIDGDCHDAKINDVGSGQVVPAQNVDHCDIREEGCEVLQDDGFNSTPFGGGTGIDADFNVEGVIT